MALRTTLRFAIVNGLGTIILLAVTGLAAWTWAVESLDALLESEVREVISFIEGFPQRPIDTILNNLADSHGTGIMFIEVLSTSRTVVSSSDMSRWPLEPLHEARAKIPVSAQPHFASTHVPGRENSIRLLTMPAPRGYTVFAGHEMIFEAAFREYAWVLIALGVLMSLLGSIAGYNAVAYAMRGVRTVTEAAHEFGAGEFERDIPYGAYGREIDNLGKAFTEMRDKIVILVSELRDVGSNLAHDLRTPLTRIRSQAETILRHPDADNENLTEVAYTIIEDSDRLVAMIDTMLTISALKSGKIETSVKPMDFVSVVRQACELFEPMFRENGNSFICRMPETDLTLTGDVWHLQRMVSNLLDNATKYTPTGGEVTLSVERYGDSLRLTVSNTGTVIEGDNPERVFDAYFREDSSRSTPGSGLGLHFVKAVAEAYGGRVFLHSSHEHGTTFTVELPLQS